MMKYIPLKKNIYIHVQLRVYLTLCPNINRGLIRFTDNMYVLWKNTEIYAGKKIFKWMLAALKKGE